MLFLSEELSAIAEADVSRLVTEGMREGKTLEFKQSVPTEQTEEKKEFLADVCSFANTGGGHIVYGVVEEAGVATRICGITETDFDALSLRLESSVRDGIEPRVPLVRTRHITLSTGPTVLILEIGRSWVSPHMVTYKGTSRFFARTSAGKYQLDVQEIRSAFIGSEGATQRIRAFRTDRIAKIISTDTGLELYSNACVVLHVCPFSPDGREILSIPQMQNGNNSRYLSPMRSQGWSERITVDGLVRYHAAGGDDRVLLGYSQIFRTGYIESVNCSMLSPRGRDQVSGVPSGVFEHAIAESLGNSLTYLGTLGIEAPAVIALSLLNVSGYEMLMPTGWYGEHHKIDRAHLILPDLLVADLRESPHKILKPSFDAIWNACGFRGSQNYGSDGNWVAKS